MARDAGNTWGVSGPDFLAFYVPLTIAAALGGLLVLRAARRPASGPVRPGEPQLNLSQVALLTGGPANALRLALYDLYQRGLLVSRGSRLVRRRTPVDGDALDGLGAAVFEATARTAPRAGQALPRLLRDPQVGAELATLRDGLATLGLLSPALPRRRVLAALGPLEACILVGVLRVAAGIGNGKPVGWLVMLLALESWVALVLGARFGRAGTASAAGRQRTARLRTETAHLAPASRPSWNTYGTGAVALGTAVFGAGVILSADPAFASEVGIRTSALGGGVASCGGGVSSCGGGGCGGGGCGGGGCGG